jgi:hypothetical protein
MVWDWSTGDRLGPLGLILRAVPGSIGHAVPGTGQLVWVLVIWGPAMGDSHADIPFRPGPAKIWKMSTVI